MNINILDLLMEHDIEIREQATWREMIADTDQFVVYNYDGDLYCGDDFDTALMWLEGREDEIDGTG